MLQAEDNAEKGKLRVAVEDFKSALALDPTHTAHNVNLYLGLCKLLVKLGRGKDAIDSCTEALNIYEELAEALTQVRLFLIPLVTLNKIKQRVIPHNFMN